MEEKYKSSLKVWDRRMYGELVLKDDEVVCVAEHYNMDEGEEDQALRYITMICRVTRV